MRAEVKITPPRKPPEVILRCCQQGTGGIERIKLKKGNGAKTNEAKIQCLRCREPQPPVAICVIA